MPTNAFTREPQDRRTITRPALRRHLDPAPRMPPTPHSAVRQAALYAPHAGTLNRGRARV